MSKAELVYRPAKQSEKTEAGDYAYLCQIWEGLTVTTAKVWAAEMREHPDFRQYVFNPTHKIVFIDYKGFGLFVKWKSRNRYRPKKETLAEMLKNIEVEKRFSA
ncbi:TPA: excisionase [Streptococcus suis]|nr:excisionase [Streptococcus suis]HEM3063981.1 excisionase [Streptococcus suis]